MSGKRDKPTILNTLSEVGVWNSNMLCLAAPIPISLQFFCLSLKKGVNDSLFVVGTWVEKETNQLSLILLIRLEYGMAKCYVLLHLSQSRSNSSVPL